MPAEIIFENSDEIELNRQPILRNVNRIGSNSECDLVFSGLQDHAFTLRYSGDTYVLTNRLTDSVRVGDKLLESGGSLTWTQAARVDVEGLLFLRLECDTHDNSPTESMIPRHAHSYPGYPRPETPEFLSVDRIKNASEASVFDREHLSVNTENKPPTLLLAIALVMSVLVGAVFLLDSKSAIEKDHEPVVTLSEVGKAFDGLNGHEGLPPDINYASLQLAVADRIADRNGTTWQTLTRTRDRCEDVLRRLENPAYGASTDKSRASLQTILRFCHQQLKSN